MIIYLLEGHLDGSIRYKIGITNKMNRRLRELMTANPTTKVVYNYTIDKKYARRVENALHNKYKSLNYAGEWFDLTYEDVCAFNDNCENIESMIKMLEKNGNPFI